MAFHLTSVLPVSLIQPPHSLQKDLSHTHIKSPTSQLEVFFLWLPIIFRIFKLSSRIHKVLPNHVSLPPVGVVCHFSHRPLCLIQPSQSTCFMNSLVPLGTFIMLGLFPEWSPPSSTSEAPSVFPPKAHNCHSLREGLPSSPWVLSWCFHSNLYLG